MTDPARLLDVGLDGSCRRAMRAAIADEPPPDAKAQLWRSITLALPAAGVLLGATTAASGAKAATLASSATGVAGAAAAGTAAAGTTATLVGSSGLGLLAGKAVAIGLGIGLALNVATGVATRVLDPKPTASVAVPKPAARALVAPAKALPAVSHAVSPTLITPTELPEAVGRAAPMVPATKPGVALEATSDELREESALLVRTREALNASKANTALELIAEHRQRFSGGRLVQERDALEVQALVKAGEMEQARARARAFLTRYPESPHAEKIRAIVDRS